MEITLFLVGVDAEDATGNFPFDSEESARAFALDNPGHNIYTVPATIDLSRVEMYEDLKEGR